MTHLERWVMSKLAFWVVIIAFFLELWRESFVFKMLPVDWTESIGITFSSLDWTNIWFVTTTHLCIKIGTHTQVLDFYYFKKSIPSLSFEPMMNRLKQIPEQIRLRFLVLMSPQAFWQLTKPSSFDPNKEYFSSHPVHCAPCGSSDDFEILFFCSSAWSWIKIDGSKRLKI